MSDLLTQDRTAQDRLAQVEALRKARPQSHLVRASIIFAVLAS